MSVTKELRARLEAATPAPWIDNNPDEPGEVWHTLGPGGPLFSAGEHDAALIVSAINALPALLAVAEAAEKVRCGHCGSDSFAKSCTRCGDLRRSLASLASLTRNDEVDRDGKA